MKKDATLTDEQILEQLCLAQERTEQDKFISELYYRYNERIIGWLLIKTKDLDKAQELASQTVEKLVKALRKQAGKQKENPIQQFKSWLYRIAHNVFLDDLQRQKKEKTEVFGDDTVGKPQEDRLVDDSHELLQVKLDFEYRHTLQELALFLLSESQKEVYLMRYYQKTENDKRMQVKQVAEVLDTTTRVVWTNLKTGKERLEKLITEAFKRNVTVKEPERMLERLFQQFNIELPTTPLEHQEESQWLAPALRLLPTEQSESVLALLANEGATTKTKVLEKALLNLKKMIEGKRHLEQLIEKVTTNS